MDTIASETKNRVEYGVGGVGKGGGEASDNDHDDHSGDGSQQNGSHLTGVRVELTRSVCSRERNAQQTLARAPARRFSAVCACVEWGDARGTPN